MIFNGRVRVRYPYSRWGWTRNSGKGWHGGIDEEGLDSATILMPGYNGKAISGTVVTARKVDKASGNPTWEWGWYVCVRLDANQTPDAVNYLYFCHNSSNLVRVGQRVKTGDALAVMGNTGNAALASPPFDHCHFEVRATATGRGLDPTAYVGHPNAVGTYGEAAPPDKHYEAAVLADGLRLRTYPQAAAEYLQIGRLERGQVYPLKQTKNGWAFLLTQAGAGGWACIEDAGGKYLDIREARP